MKKRLMGLILALCLALTLVPVTTVRAEAQNITVTGSTYHANGSLKSLTFNFYWRGETAQEHQMVIMTEETDVSQGEFGSVYDLNFLTFEDVKNYDNSNHTFGIVSASQVAIQGESTQQITVSFAESDLPLDVDETYYLYVWTKYAIGGLGEGHYYPDNLFCMLKVENGTLSYSLGENAYENIPRGYGVTIVPSGNMTRESNSGAASQNSTGSAITSVVYTANDGYYFPDNYAVNSVNGITVTRNSDTQITVAGTPTADTMITLVAPSTRPVVSPTTAPTVAPTTAPTVAPTVAPTTVPTIAPTTAPAIVPTVAPVSASTVAPVPTSVAVESGWPVIVHDAYEDTVNNGADITEENIPDNNEDTTAQEDIQVHIETTESMDLVIPEKAVQIMVEQVAIYNIYMGGIVVTLSSEALADVDDDIDIKVNVEYKTDFGQGFDAIYVTSRGEFKLSDVGYLNIVISKEEIGNPAYVYILTDDGTYRPLMTQTISDLGTIAIPFTTYNSYVILY